MFSKDQTAGRVVCLADYGRVNMGAIVPITNELHADVEAWMAEGNTLAEFDGYPEIPMTPEQLQDWRENAEVSAYQAFAALEGAGYLDQVEGMMGDTKTPKRTRLAFHKAQVFKRNSPTVANIAAVLGLTEAQIDDLFREAATIEA